jgi:hypothetical protein
MDWQQIGLHYPLTRLQIIGQQRAPLAAVFQPPTVRVTRPPSSTANASNWSRLIAV